MTCKQTRRLKIERKKTALMHVNEQRTTKASDKSRSILEVSDEKSESKRRG